MSGLCYETHYFKALLDFGFQRILGWECVYFHPSHQVILNVYVDDSKLAGKQLSLALAWRLLRDKVFRLDPPEAFNE